LTVKKKKTILAIIWEFLKKLWNSLFKN
jgi:hypothetical protein